MKNNKWVIAMILTVMAIALSACATKRHAPIMDEHTQKMIMPHSPNVFLIMYDAKTGREPLMKAIKDYGAEIIYDYHSINGMALSKPKDRTLEETMEFFRKVKGILSVEYDHIYKIDDPVAKPIINMPQKTNDN